MKKIALTSLTSLLFFALTITTAKADLAPDPYYIGRTAIRDNSPIVYLVCCCLCFVFALGAGIVGFIIGKNRKK